MAVRTSKNGMTYHEYEALICDPVLSKQKYALAIYQMCVSHQPNILCLDMQDRHIEAFQFINSKTPLIDAFAVASRKDKEVAYAVTVRVTSAGEDERAAYDCGCGDYLRHYEYLNEGWAASCWHIGEVGKFIKRERGQQQAAWAARIEAAKLLANPDLAVQTQETRLREVLNGLEW